MASWYSNLLTKTSSGISSLKSTLLSSEADGDTEDDTHVCRVLRDFYAERGRPFPPWLPPDPKGATANPVPQPVYAQSQVGGQRYGAAGPQQQQQGPGAAGFGSLWDNNNTNNNNNHHHQNGNAPPQLQVQTQSLRAGRAGQSVLSPIGTTGLARDDPNNRILSPATRAGSYPNPASQTSGTAQDRLRQRLWGGARTTSPSAQGGPFQPPPSPGGYAAGGGGGGGGDYDKPFMGSNAPWSNGGDDYMGGGGVPASLRRPAPPNGQRGYR